jgi:hypothetical protein
MSRDKESFSASEGRTRIMFPSMLTLTDNQKRINLRLSVAAQYPGSCDSDEQECIGSIVGTFSYYCIQD